MGRSGRLGFFLADNGNEYGGVIHAYHNSGSGLTRHHASFQRNGMLTVLEFTNDRIKQNNILSIFDGIIRAVVNTDLLRILATNDNPNPDMGKASH